MRVTSIDLYSDRFEENLRFSLQHTSTFDKYMIRQIVGLDAEELVPRFYGFGRRRTSPSGDYPKYFDFNMKPRDVAMRVILNPNFSNNESYSDVRDELYKMISATRSGELILYFNAGATTVAQLKGFITKFEAGYFQALPEVQITVRCEDPLFKGVGPVIYDLDDSEYPDPIVVDGYLQVPDSLSTAPHGFKFEAVYTAEPPGSDALRLRDLETLFNWNFDVLYDFDAGDTVYFSSVAGEKTVYVTKAVDPDTKIFLLDKITSISSWPLVFPGQNSIYCNHVPTLVFHHVEYNPTYWGV